MARPLVIFVHGVFIWEPDWWWQHVAALLDECGIDSRTVQLPSTGWEAPLGDLHDDAAAIRRAIDEADGPVILIGHSYGGMVITEAAFRHPKVVHLVYMSAFVPDGTSAVMAELTNPADVEAFETEVGGSGVKSWILSRALSIGDGAPTALMLKWLVGGGIRARIATALVGLTAGDGYITNGEGGSKSYILEELEDPELVEGSLRRLARQSVSSAIQKPSGEAWREIPSTFMLILHDVDVSVQRQLRHAARCTNVVEVPTNHFAHLERPELVRDVLVDVASQACEHSYSKAH
jgi:pimeloyl-ACP methyl ester carboxylesterase